MADAALEKVTELKTIADQILGKVPELSSITVSLEWGDYNDEVYENQYPDVSFQGADDDRLDEIPQVRRLERLGKSAIEEIGGLIELGDDGYAGGQDALSLTFTRKGVTARISNEDGSYGPFEGTPEECFDAFRAHVSTFGCGR